jgi:hypothetical protein
MIVSSHIWGYLVDSCFVLRLRRRASPAGYRPRLRPWHRVPQIFSKPAASRLEPTASEQCPDFALQVERNDAVIVSGDAAFDLTSRSAKLDAQANG